MKKEYKKPLIEIVEIEKDEIISTSEYDKYGLFYKDGYDFYEEIK